MNSAELITKDELNHMINEVVTSYTLPEFVQENFKQFMEKSFIEFPELFDHMSINDIDVAMDDSELYIDFVVVNDLKKIQHFITIVINSDHFIVENKEYSDDEESDFFRDLLRETVEELTTTEREKLNTTIIELINHLKSLGK